MFCILCMKYEDMEYTWVAMFVSVSLNSFILRIFPRMWYAPT